jgi:hypothetical protein
VIRPKNRCYLRLSTSSSTVHNKVKEESVF